jgi:AcrR family transcriptional regulator
MNRISRQQPLKPRKVPRQPRSAETVASIIEAAAQILETAGLEGFNTNAVARRAGVSIGSLYQYFPGKDALILALMRREKARFYEDAAAALGKPSGKAALEYLIGASVRQQLQRPVLARLLDVEESRPGLSKEMAAGDTLQSLLITIIARAKPGQKRPEVAAGDMLAMIQGIVDAAGARREKDIEDLERRVRAALFGYLSRIGKG